MTKTARMSMIGVLVAVLLALFAVAGCSGDNANDQNAGGNDNAASTDNGNNGDNNNGGNNADNNGGNGNNADNNGGGDSNANGNGGNGANQMGDGSSVGEGTVLKVPNGWVAYSQSDMLVLLDSTEPVDYQWMAEVEGNTVLKDTDSDIPSSSYNDQNADDVVGAPGMHVFGFLADDQNNGESTITMKLANVSDANDVKNTIVVKATVENGMFTNASVQE